MEEYIKFQNITKIFPGQKALDDVSFSVEKGEIHAIIGENGAGKSTLLNILHGVYEATDGKVFIDNKAVHFNSIFDSIEYGIIKVHQEINIVPELTVWENLMLGKEITKGLFLNSAQMIKETQDILDALSCDFSAKEKIKNLGTGQTQMVQIAKALRLNAKIISFDEPTSSLSDAEVKILFKIIDDLKNQGITILYISHKMDEIFKICDKATVLRDGKYVTTFDIKSTSKEELIKSMVGRDVSMFARRKNPSVATEEVVLKVDNLSNTIGYSDVSFQLKKGEILGFFGLIGAQRTEVMRGIFGADPITRGKIYLNGKQIINHSPFDGVKNNIALIPENRKEEGFVKNLCNADNIALACINNFMKGLFLDNGKKEQNAIKYGKAVGLYPNDPEFMTAYLSGGNAQKVILAKWISTNAEVFIFDEPTKGIDIGAKAEIYKLMEEMLEQGKSIIMVSSELTEVIGMSDRLIVMKEGSIVAELQKNELSEETIIALAVGGKN